MEHAGPHRADEPNYEKPPYEQPQTTPARIKGRFAPDHSGNPKGRPPGSKNKKKPPTTFADAAREAVAKDVVLKDGTHLKQSYLSRSFDSIAKKFAEGHLPTMRHVEQAFDVETLKIANKTAEEQRRHCGVLVVRDGQSPRKSPTKHETPKVTRRRGPSRNLLEALSRPRNLNLDKKPRRTSLMQVGCEQLAIKLANGEVAAVALYNRLAAKLERLNAITAAQNKVGVLVVRAPARSEKEWMEEAKNCRLHPNVLHGIAGVEALAKQWDDENPTLVAEYWAWVEAQEKRHKKLS